MNSESTPAYCGRFAPSPTGELHFGSLVAALGSWLDARAAGGRWLLRIEDVDAPRCIPGAESAILATLAACGLKWDGPVVRQSERLDAYAEAMRQLQQCGAVYPCSCSRSEIQSAAGQRGLDGAWVYPRTCLARLPDPARPWAWRLAVGMTSVAFDDRLQGRIESALERDVGDFVVRRADGLFAYQLAVVVDDAWQGVTHVVRGADLLDSTPRQIHLIERLSLKEPSYLHLPVAVNAAGEKLSKQTCAPAIDAGNPLPAMHEALRFLGFDITPEIAAKPVARLLDWAQRHWDVQRLPARRTIAAPGA